MTGDGATYYQRNRERKLEYQREYSLRLRLAKGIRVILSPEERKESVRTSKRLWRERNPDKVKAAAKAWREANREKVNQNALNDYYKHRDKRAEKNRERAREWYRRLCAESPERARKISAAWRKANPERNRELKRAYWARLKADPERLATEKVKARERDRLWREANPDKAREQRRRWDEANPDRRRELGARQNDQATAALRFLREIGLIKRSDYGDDYQTIRKVALAYAREQGLLPVLTNRVVQS
jgi:hypothetical protein